MWEKIHVIERPEWIEFHKKAVSEVCPDGPRYRAIGNSMAVPVMRWLGERIKQVESGEL